VLAQELGVLLGDPVDEQCHDHRHNQRARPHLLSGGSDDGRRDDGAVDSGRAPAAAIGLLDQFRLTRHVRLRVIDRLSYC
jgi:hypothetical protein